MTTDRELLTLAAKAAGIKDTNSISAACRGERIWWNPLSDDGDALRLAVKLHMTVRCYMGNTCAQIGVPGQQNAYADEVDHANPCAATRRAIVRAAAAIGEQTP